MMRAAILLTLLTLVLAVPATASAAVTVTSGQTTEGGKITFTVTSDQPATVQFTTVDDSAKAAEKDYETKTQTLNLAPIINPSDDVEVQTLEDGAAEMDEQFKVTATPAGGQPVTGTGKIVDNDEPTISVSDVSVSESAGKVDLKVTTSPVSRDVSVGYATADDSAGAEDFTSTSGRLSFKAGESGGTISVPINNDAIDENDERFRLTLGNPTGAKIGNATATITITNDDVRLVSVGDIGVVESDLEPSVARFPIQLSAPTFRTVTVNFSTIDGPAAKAPRDYLARTGTVVFLPGQTIQFIDVGIVSDDVTEPSEFFGLLIGQADGARILKAAALAAIRDDDAADGPRGADRESPRMQLTKPRLSSSRSIRARVTCPSGEQRCRGRLVLYGRVGTAERRIGAKTFSLPGNAARTLRITIPASILRRARRSGRLPLRAYLVTSDAAENVDTKELSATLRFKRTRSSSRSRSRS